MARTAKEKAYLAAAEKAAPAPMTGIEKAQESLRLHQKMEGLDSQMKEVGAKLAAAKAAKDANAQKAHEELLLENFRIRTATVGALRGLGETVNDPYVA